MKNTYLLFILFCMLACVRTQVKNNENQISEQAATTKEEQDAVKEEVTEMMTEEESSPDLFKAPEDPFRPEYDYQLEAKIKQAVSHLVDVEKIYKVYQYHGHHVVHILDRKDRTKTGVVYVNKDLDKFNYVTLIGGNPYQCSFPVDTSYLGFPVYDLIGKSRAEVEAEIPNVVWDNTGEPTRVGTLSFSSNFGPTYKANGYRFNIMGTNGTMAVQSKIYLLDKTGSKVDSIERIGSEVWHPAVTDDGRYMAYLYGRAYPKEGGGDETTHLTIYDVEKKAHIFEIRNYEMYGSRIVANNNFIISSEYYDPPDYSKHYYVVYDPAKRKVYRGFRGQGGDWHPRFTEEGIMDKNLPGKLLINWEKDFEVIPFENYKQ